MAPSRTLSGRARRLLAPAAAVALAAAGASAATASPAPDAPRPAAAAPAAGAAAACTALICEDFEAQTGTKPAGRWTTDVANCSGTGTVAMDTAQAHSGGRSVRVDGKAGYCNHAFFGTPLTDVPTASPLYVRYWVRHTTALPTAHVTFLAMRDRADNNRDLRMGGQNGALQWNRESDDATLPEQSPAGVALSAPLPLNTWTCLEYRIDRSAGRLETWLNGTSVAGLAVDGTPTHDIDRQWLNRANWRPDPDNLRFGWESYGSGDDTLWYDDIAVGTSRIGCQS